MSEAEAVLPPHPSYIKPKSVIRPCKDFLYYFLRSFGLNQLIFGNDYFTNILVALHAPFFCSTLITNEPLSGFFTSTPWRLK